MGRDNKKKIITVGVVIVLLICIVVMLLNNGTKLTEDTLTVEAGSELEYSVEDFFNVDEEKAEEFTFDESGVDTSKVGEYELLANYKKKEYTIKVVVEDTTAPKVKFDGRYVFTNNLAEVKLQSEVQEYSEYTSKLVYFEKKADLSVMNDEALKKLEDTIPVPCDQEELAKLVSEEVPEAEGVYRSVLKLEDVHGNVQLEEVYVIYDKTPSKIDDVADKTIKVAKDKLGVAPTVDAKEYKITDNVDGVVEATCELELTDEKGHVYINHVSYVDRAGNVSEADFKITLVEEDDDEDDKKATSSKDTTSSNKNNSSSSPNKNNSSSNKGNTTSSSSSSSNSSSSSSSGESQSSSSDEVEKEELDPGQKAAVDAGYYKVTADPNNNGYVVMVRGNEYDRGYSLLEEYLNNMGYELYNGGGWGSWLDSSKDQYLVGAYANQIREKTPDESDDDFWTF